MRLGVLAAALLLVVSAPASAKVFPYPYQLHTLANGLKVYFVPMPSEGLVAYYSVVRTGSRDEVEPGHSGFAHFFEHMMFRGTEKYPGRVYDEIITSMGADANAYTTDDYTCYHRLSTPDLPKARDRGRPLPPMPSPISRRSPARSTASTANARSSRKVRALQVKAYDVHTYKHTTIGFEADVKAMPQMYDYSKSFQRFYRPENIVLMVVGDFDPAKTLTLIEQNYGGWKTGYTAPKVTPEPEQTARRTIDVSYEGRTLPILTLAYKGTAFDPKSKEVAAGLLLGRLVFGETSPVYKDLVLDRQLVQDLGSDFGMNRDVGLWTVFASVNKEEDMGTVQAALLAAVQSYQATPPDAQRLKDIQKRARYEMLMGLDTPDHTAGAVARYVALTGNPMPWIRSSTPSPRWRRRHPGRRPEAPDRRPPDGGHREGVKS
jgi:zinc protease